MGDHHLTSSTRLVLGKLLSRYFIGRREEVVTTKSRGCSKLVVAYLDVDSDSLSRRGRGLGLAHYNFWRLVGRAQQ